MISNNGFLIIFNNYEEAFYLNDNFHTSSFSQEKNECDERTMPYWAYGINSRVEEVILALKKAWKVFD